MNILLDTHILIWSLEGSDKLSKKHLEIILDEDNIKFVSQISFLELAIKLKIGKIFHSNITIESLIEDSLNCGFEILPLQNKHLSAYHLIPLHDEHKDPFDRMLLATALSENMAIITEDNKFDLYQDIVQIF